MSSKEPYENVYIGNFIYSLGYLSAKFNESSEDAGVHLIQQTPNDKKWADLLTRWNGKFFILEFKREEIGCKQELRKKYCKKGVCKKDCVEHRSTYFMDIKKPECDTLKNIAEKSHFIGFGEKIEKVRTISFFPYSELTFVDKLNREFVIPLNQLCNNIISGEKGADEEEFSQYMTFLASCVKEGADGGDGFIVNIDTDGNINLVDIKDYKTVAQDLSISDPVYSNPAMDNSNRSTYRSKF